MFRVLHSHARVVLLVVYGKIIMTLMELLLQVDYLNLTDSDCCIIKDVRETHAAILFSLLLSTTEEE
jgi:hypothetical protein